MTVLRGDGAPLVGWPLVGAGRPDLSVVACLARFVLLARRGGYRVVLTQIDADLLDLLELAGLRGQMVGEAEGGEDPVGVQETVEPGDPAV